MGESGPTETVRERGEASLQAVREGQHWPALASAAGASALGTSRKAFLVHILR